MSGAVQMGLPMYVPLRRKVRQADGTIEKVVVAHAIVDAADYERVVAASAWRLDSHGYVAGRLRGTRTAITLHRFIMEPPKGLLVDHINGDKLDNRRCNLRVCTVQENNRNKTAGFGGSSRFRGVHLRKSDSRWRAQITHEGRQLWLGDFHDERDAALAYDEAARLLFGDFASPNLPDEQCPRDVRERVHRRVAGECTVCGSPDHHGGECPAGPCAPGPEHPCCGRRVYEKHARGCVNAGQVGRRKGDRGKCSRCGTYGHNARGCRAFAEGGEVVASTASTPPSPGRPGPPRGVPRQHDRGRQPKPQ